MAMVTMPGTIAEKFYFTVPDDAVAKKIDATVGTRVVLHYEQHRWIPNSCFAETEYFVTDVRGGQSLPHEFADRLQVLDVVADRLEDHHDRQAKDQAPAAPQPAPEQAGRRRRRRCSSCSRGLRARASASSPPGC